MLLLVLTAFALILGLVLCFVKADLPESNSSWSWANILWILLCTTGLLSLFQKKRKCIKDEVVVITGAAGGIGSEMAFKLANLGAKLVLIDTDEVNNKGLEKLLVSDGCCAKAFTCDVKFVDQLENVAKLVYGDPNLGRCDILICNAGTMIAKKIIDISIDEIREVMDVNAMGYIYAIKTFYPDMLKRQKGHIVSVNSVSAFAGLERLSMYSASKFALRGFLESLILEMRDTGFADLTATCVYPFIVRTKLIKDYDIISKLPLMEAEEAAEAIVDSFLRQKHEVLVPLHARIIFYYGKCLLPLPVIFYLAKVFKIQFIPKTVGLN